MILPLLSLQAGDVIQWRHGECIEQFEVVRQRTLVDTTSGTPLLRHIAEIRPLRKFTSSEPVQAWMTGMMNMGWALCENGD